jgi:hypothetical protein
MGYALPPEQSYLIWCLAWLAHCVALFGLLRGYVLLAAVHFLAGCFALAYWNDPDMTSWRRTFDIAWVQITLWTFCWEARNAEFRLPFYVFAVLAMVAYPIGWLFMDSPWISGIAHAFCHVFAESAAFVLFSGRV